MTFDLMMITNGRPLKHLTVVALVVALNFIFGTEIFAAEEVYSRFPKSTSQDFINIRCFLGNCSLNHGVLSVLQHQDVSFICNLTTRNQLQENHALQIILVDVDREFVLGDDSCRWQRRLENDEYLYCDLYIAQNFNSSEEKHLAYLIDPWDFYESFTVAVEKENTHQTSECNEALEELSSTMDMVTKRRTQPSVHLYSGDEISDNEPSLMGKVIVGGIGLVVIIVALIILKRYCQERRRNEEPTEMQEVTHMIVYKTQPTWCQDPDTDSDMDEMEPFLSHDSDE